MEKRIIVYLLLFLSPRLMAQRSNNDIDFVIRQIEKNYPGFTRKITPAAWRQLVQRVRNSSKKDTLQLLSVLTTYFKDKHLVVYDMNGFKEKDSAVNARRWQKVRDYLDDPVQQKNNYEGYWRSEFNNCIMAIRKTANNPLVLRGYVVAASSSIQQGAEICELEQTDGRHFFMGFTDADFGYKMFVMATFNHDRLQASSYGRWKKMNNYHPDSAKTLTGFNYKASLTILDSNNILIRIPENNLANTRRVDSLVLANKPALGKTKNLIIDVRNNIGGTVRTYASLLPYINTGPIIRWSDSIFCSEEFIGYQRKLISNKRRIGDTSNIKKQQRVLELAEANIGKYIFIPADTLRFDSIHRYPVHVGIIANYASLSAAELMLLECRQSKKVKTFGETTGGAVDYPDFFPLTTPGKKYILYMPSGKRAILKGDRHLDATGIQPDIPIRDQEPDWVNFVKAYYEKYP